MQGRTFPYEIAGLRNADPSWRLRAAVTPIEEGSPIEVELPEGRVRLRRFATVPVRAAALTLFWIEGYGGGLFLPFQDLTNGAGTYGGGRYLYDTIKGADLGADSGQVVLDFNFAYNPSCAYSPDWVCPLAPRENSLPFAVEAGERDYV